MADKVKITIEGVEREVDPGKNILQVILDEGLTIPHFCYHEALGAVGSCRLCACQIAPGADKPARLEMSCMVRPTDGMVVTVNEPYAKNFRRQVIEDLMLNHPHDCPVCDEGGECMLQDMTVLSEHQHRRNRFNKRTWDNQYLGPTIHHEMNRCITCYRCVRYYRDYAMGDDFGVFGSRDRVYFGRVEEGVLESEFAGNLLDVCPTGVFTNKRFRENYTRPWDLLTAKSVCVSCSVGCNVLPGYRHNTLRRIKPNGNPAVNKHFMCDRGRFGGEFVNHPSRLTDCIVDGATTGSDQAVESIAAKLKEIATKHGARSIAGIGSSRSSLEANAALALLVKALGSGRLAFFNSGKERSAIRRAAALTASGDFVVPSLPELEAADCILVLGGDLTAEAPMMDLSIRQSIRKGAGLYIASPRAGELDQFAKASLRTIPGEESQIASFIASIPRDATDPADDNFVQLAGRALREAKNPLILCSVCHADSALVESAAELCRNSSSASRMCKLAYFFPAANSVGAGLIRDDENPDAIWADVEAGRIKALVIVEQDVSRAFPDPQLFAKAVSKCELVVLIDSIDSPTVQSATALLPCVSHYQSFGTFLNYEGRGQRFDGMQFASSVILAASEMLVTLIHKAGLDEAIGGTDFVDVFDVTPESSRALDVLRVHDSGFVVRTASQPAAEASEPRPSRRPEGALVRWDVTHFYGSEELSALSAPVAELAPQPYVELHPDDARARGFKDGEDADLTREFGETARLRVNPELAKGTAAFPILLTRAAEPAEVVAG